jgi:hypothetical protein
MMKIAERYVAVLPRLEWIFLGNWAVMHGDLSKEQVSEGFSPVYVDRFQSGTTEPRDHSIQQHYDHFLEETFGWCD